MEIVEDKRLPLLQLASLLLLAILEESGDEEAKKAKRKKKEENRGMEKGRIRKKKKDV